MGLVLSSQDVARFTTLQEALLTPLQYESIDTWCAAVLRRADALFGADRSAMFIPMAGQIHYVSESIDPRSLEAFRSGLGESQPGALRFTENLVDQAWAARRAEGLEVWSIRILERLLGRSMEQVEMYHEAVKPAGLVESAVATTAMPAGEAFLGISHSRPADASFDERERLQLMGMLVPALKAGVNSVVRLDAERATLALTLDALGDATLVCDQAGRTLHHSRRLEEFLAADPAATQVLAEMRALAGSLASMRLTRSELQAAPTGTREMDTATARYHLRGTYIGTPSVGVGDAVLVVLDRLTPELPSPERLIECYTLTPREAEIALLLAQGFSNQEIGDRLAISPHTVRHHVEWIFTKLGVHTRKALGLKLLSRYG